VRGDMTAFVERGGAWSWVGIFGDVFELEFNRARAARAASSFVPDTPAPK
jgi:hypothetical protein